jgi:hypothetical protein
LQSASAGISQRVECPLKSWTIVGDAVTDCVEVCEIEDVRVVLSLAVNAQRDTSASNVISFMGF